MVKIGIICEYSPFHNGHIYHINKIKEMYPDSMIILIESGNFLERGTPSIIDKYDKTEISLNYNIDLCIELPFCYATESADTFALYSIKYLNILNVDYLVFGSESNNVNKLYELAKIQNSKKYKDLLKNNQNKNINYPTLLNNLYKEYSLDGINSPNDLLGLSYIKALIKTKSKIKPITIKRTNDYKSLELNKIASGTSIINAIKNNVDIKDYVPKETYSKLNNIYFQNDYFNLLKYKVLTESIDDINDMPKGFPNKIKKEILETDSWEELVLKLKNKYYTYNRINRLLLHILCNFTKKRKKEFKNISFIRVLGFNNKGKNYLNLIKKNLNIPIITTFSKLDNNMLKYEQLVDNIYYLYKGNDFIKYEYTKKVIIKDK